MKTIFLATNNIYKVEEVAQIGITFGYNIEQFKCDIRELQTLDRDRLIRHKTVEAFSQLRGPVLVDHASLEIDCLNSMPGTLTQLFWDKLEGTICNIVTALGPRSAKAICTVGYCNGKKIFSDECSVTGLIADKPEGNRNFQWDTIFIPDGQTRTYGEMTITEKNAISQRRQAFENMFATINKL
ncbi:MAG: hypothetical protein BGO21_26195 [Dyadobacter sp. 50-39]|uniref:non-canonical purine NTP pyrophosphatase n=1 Tax=Dyadobacter sp. 50-39 TaxID=1895756 RepID=UPI000967689F|nr:non-canonical purine NTP pyrophosphatase [Dyadobacter sp. 50-39]OJV16392.1 MAG: hypothetical protein BGO21_26195 [Dyadobacter sp. 50-39]